ncbi:MAG TPA: AMP-binding protein, partial [Stellaceae bacterium]|nr:AMP-binding protein [Stellaceae bacterium]
MTATWSVHDLLSDLAAAGGRPAIIAFSDDGAVVWSCATLARRALDLVDRLSGEGFADGSRIALWAPNSPAWIASALAVLACGAVLVPLDDLADAAQLDTALSFGKPRLILTAANHSEACGSILRRAKAGTMLVEASERLPGDASAATAEAGDRVKNLPALGDAAPAILSWTSGTTGSPKAFLLTHGNIAANVAALRNLAIVGADDRVLLPLPLHHAYPFVVGMLAPLAAGTAIVLPEATTGPALARAMREGRVTAIVGVPRLYEALLTGIEAQIGARSRAARRAWPAILRTAAFAQRSTGLRLGRLLFAPVRRRVAPSLRLLVAGGARLPRDTEEQLEALGWSVLSGYGLAETASLFTGNRPVDRRVGSAGKPLAGGEVRIAEPDADGIGKVELRGPSITSGYIDNPDANRDTFTPDGWFRTGDLGFIDRDGFLFVTGRATEVVVLGGGKKVNPEDLERIYGAAPEIVELAVLEVNGALVALVRPDAARLRARGATNLRDGIRIVLGETAQGLPSYQRLSGFALTDRPLPRTRLGKYRRFLLPVLYKQATAGGIRRVSNALGPEDAALLHNPTAAAVWRLLQQRYPGAAIDLDVDLPLDLNLDSFGWMELTLLLHDQLGVTLSDADITEIRTIRDLLDRAVEPRQGAFGSARANQIDVERWFAPRGVLLAAFGAALYALNWLLMRGCFRLQVYGRDRLPETGAFVITPNHVSYLDGMAIAASLPIRRLNSLYWAGDARLLFSNPIARTVCRALHVFAVEA